MGGILVVTNSLTGGGAERSMNSLVNLIHANGIDVSLFPINEGPIDEVTPDCQVIPPVRVWKAGALSTLISLFRFKSKVSDLNPSVVIVNCELPEMYSVFLPMRMKLIIVEHTSKPWKNHKLLGLLIRNLAKLRQSHWVLVSDHLKSNYLCKDSTSVIHNLISASENRLAEGVSPEPRIVFIGRISPEKDPQLFLEIADLSSFPAVVIGTGVLLESLLSHDSQTAGGVTYLGQLNNPWEVLHQNDIILITSRFEGDCLVLLEALARNLPVLIRDIPDLRRFGLPEVNYFQTANVAANALRACKSNPAALTIPGDIADQILSQRDEKLILASWINLIERFIAP